VLSRDGKMVSVKGLNTDVAPGVYEDLVSAQRGSHIILTKQTVEGKVGCVVPLHRQLAIGTLRGILRQAGISPDEFMEKVKG